MNKKEKNQTAMDPLSQAVVGATLPMTNSRAKNLRLALFCGVIGGLFPDIDILIRSESDPLLALEYHRHFTHALFSIPFIGIALGFMLWGLFSRKKERFKQYALFTTLGVATHGMLDGCTAYGTYLLWPFSDERISFQNISIIDPLFTVPLLIFVVFSAIFKSTKTAKTAFIYTVAYLGLSFYNKHLVTQEVEKIAAENGHKVERIFLNPTLGNNILWRTVYEANGSYYANAVYHIPFYESKHIKGQSVKKVTPETALVNTITSPLQRQDIKRFNNFAMGYLYEVNDRTVSDFRYSLAPESAEPMWQLTFNPQEPNSHGVFQRGQHDREKALENLIKMLFHFPVP